MSISNVGLPSKLITPFCLLGDTTNGASGFLEIQSGSSNPLLPNTPDQLWTLEVSAKAVNKGHFTLTGQAAGPSPGVEALDIYPDGTIHTGSTAITGALTVSTTIEGESYWCSAAALNAPVQDIANGSSMNFVPLTTAGGLLPVGLYTIVYVDHRDANFHQCVTAFCGKTIQNGVETREWIVSNDGRSNSGGGLAIVGNSYDNTIHIENNTGTSRLSVGVSLYPLFSFANTAPFTTEGAAWTGSGTGTGTGSGTGT